MGENVSAAKTIACEAKKVPKIRVNSGSAKDIFYCNINYLVAGWGAWIRTREWRNQNPLPYHLATPHPSRRARRRVTARAGGP
jgi:hypothetical protein